MKKGMLLGCMILFLFGANISVQAAPEICGATAPASCFSALADGSQAKIRTNPPDHCQNPELVGVSDQGPFSLVLQALGPDLKIPLVDKTGVGMKVLQIFLSKQCKKDAANAEDPGCIPTTAIKDRNGNSATCTADGFIDGKYGVCTEEAVRRYIAWQKVNNPECSDYPTLTITPPGKLFEGELTFDIKAEYPGNIWVWEDAGKFKEGHAKTADITIKDINLSSERDGIIVPLIQEKITLTGDIAGKITETLPAGIFQIFTKNGTVTVGDKTFTLGNDQSQKFTIKRIEADKNLSCNHLLPKYLIGAKCTVDEADEDKALYGDARDITYWIQRFSGQITSFIAAIAVLIISWNAFGLIMSAGDSDKIASNKKAIMWVGLGLLLTIFAYVIVKTIIALSFMG